MTRASTQSSPMRGDFTLLPTDVRTIAQTLATLPGAVAVSLGGSRATSAADAASDWDLAVHYRGALNLRPLETYGEVWPPGTWGRIMNGGAWLRVGDTVVDVILRDLDVVMHWRSRRQ